MVYYAAITFLIQIDYIFLVILISYGLVPVGRYFYNICTSVSDSAPGCDTDISIPAHRYLAISILKCRYFQQFIQTNTTPTTTAVYF